MDHLAAQALQEEGHKSSLAFRTISEVSQEIDVPQHVLRFWESRFSQIKPLKRGGGRRYYRPEDIQLLISIKNYLYKQGYTIKGVQRLLKEGRSSVSENTPSFQAYRRDMADEVAQEIPPEDFDDAFGENASEAAAPLETAPAEGNAVARGLSAVSEIHDQLENPAPPMRVDPAAKPADKKTLNASKLTPAIKTELRGILDELKTLREMLRGGSN